MKILAVESSTKHLSVSLSKDGQEISSSLLKSDKGFMSNIINVIDKVLRKSKAGLKNVDSFAANTGPGDFTGTRIGLSIIKTLSLVENKPVFAINCPDVYAASILDNNAARINSGLLKSGSALVVPVIDVKRNELFFSVYEAGFSSYNETISSSSARGATLYVRKVTKDFLVDFESFISKLEEVLLSASLIMTDPAKTAIYCGGTALDSYGHIAVDLKKIGCNFIINKKTIFPHAAYINRCAAYRAGIGDKAGDKNIIPVYVREFVPFK